MKLSGWIFMALTWGFILWLALFSFRKILETKENRTKRKGGD
jgi:hypothetical protein